MKSQETIVRARNVIRRQHKALATEDAYLGWLRRYFSAIRQMPGRLLRPPAHHPC